MDRKFELTSAQRSAADGLLSGISACGVLALRSASGMGRTSILRHVQSVSGGALVGLHDFIELLKGRQPQAIEETFADLVQRACAVHETVIVDDLHLLWNVSDGMNYPRSWLLNATLTALLDQAEAADRKIVFGLDTDTLPAPLANRARVWQVKDLPAADYAALCRQFLGAEGVSRLDFESIHRFAPNLSVWQLKNACAFLRAGGALETSVLLDYLREHNLASNVQLEEVRPVELKDLKGVDDVIRALEAKVALPFENHALATEFNLKARRGVLLAGPPGTGKTTIGRAMARRLKGKFFLIDGTAISGCGDFYQTVDQIFAAATQNAPSIVFIDDTDVIFEGNSDRGLYRYLLTKLDGLESASADRVCVMMTAMDPASLPPALLRSGRIELWLETRLPDAEARGSILREGLAKLPSPFNTFEICSLISASQGLTGADLKSVIEDGKLLIAHDKALGNPVRLPETYFVEAIATVRANHRNYAKRKPGPFGQGVEIGFSSPATE